MRRFFKNINMSKSQEKVEWRKIGNISNEFPLE